jgi:hypothetical protein
MNGGQTRTIDEWRADQESDLYDEMNSDWMEVVLKAKTLGMVEFSKRSLDLFFIVSSNLDMFREFVFNSNFLNAYIIDRNVIQRIREDELEEDELEFLKFSMKWLRFATFGEGDFKVKEDARKKAKERRRAAGKEKLKEKIEREKEILSKTSLEDGKDAH